MPYKIIFTNDSIRDMDSIFKYISENLYAPESARRLMRKVNDAINNLSYMPKINTKIEKYYGLKMEHRRIVINNYVIIYTIDEKNKIVYIINMYYGGMNYLQL